jgi:hypothetical protein
VWVSAILKFSDPPGSQKRVGFLFCAQPVRKPLPGHFKLAFSS